MSKVFLVARAADRRRLLNALGALGVMHLTPVEPARAKPDDQTVTTLDHLSRAMQVLAAHQPAGPAPDLTPQDAAKEVLDIQRAAAEKRSHLATLHRHHEHLAMWGNVRTEQLRELTDAGVTLRFVSVPANATADLQADCVHVIGPLPARRVLVALADLGEPAPLPQGAQELAFPTTDRPTLRAEAARIDQELRASARRLGELAHLVPQMQAAWRTLLRRSAFAVATGGALAGDDLFAVQGWAPADKLDALTAALERTGLPAAIQSAPPAPDETPPTLIRYPRWAKPIGGLFEILGTLPGYREYDVSGFFMLALPLFAAMLIADAGYGLVLALLPLIFYRKFCASLGKAKVHLLWVFAVATILWGVLTANYFGVTPESFARAGGFVDSAGSPDVAAMMSGTSAWAHVGRTLATLGPLWSPDPATLRQTLIKLSLIIGAVHLVLAHLRRAVFLAPDQQSLAEAGWCVFLAGMLGVIWLLFFGRDEPMPVPLTWIYAALIAGAALAVLFGSPSRNPLKRLGLGVAKALLPALGTFGDTMSYIRLMAVGLASYHIASAFNTIAADVASQATWAVGGLVAAAGHALNIGMAMIAIFAHGVRLNMLEFSNNAGVQWAGYPYEPFTVTETKES